MYKSYFQEHFWHNLSESFLENKRKNDFEQITAEEYILALLGVGFELHFWTKSFLFEHQVSRISFCGKDKSVNNFSLLSAFFFLRLCVRFNVAP